MKKQIIIAAISFTLSVPVSAQLSTDSIKKSGSHTARSEAGSLLATLAGALNADSYTPAYSKVKTSFANRARSATGGKSVAGNIAEFLNYIKPGKFKTGVNVEELVAQTQSITTAKQSASMLQVVEESLNPDAISSMWSLGRVAWLKDLKQLQAGSK